MVKGPTGGVRGGITVTGEYVSEPVKSGTTRNNWRRVQTRVTNKDGDPSECYLSLSE